MKKIALKIIMIYTCLLFFISVSFGWTVTIDGQRNFLDAVAYTNQWVGVSIPPNEYAFVEAFVDANKIFDWSSGTCTDLYRPQHEQEILFFSNDMYAGKLIIIPEASSGILFGIGISTFRRFRTCNSMAE